MIRLYLRLLFPLVASMVILVGVVGCGALSIKYIQMGNFWLGIGNLVAALYGVYLLNFRVLDW